MNILVILTGGTIGSTVENNVIDTTDALSYRIINLYKKQSDTECNFEVIQPFSQLSENFSIETINILVDLLKTINFSLYDGVIITHGSDTVAYTSAFISYLFSDVSCPIVFVAADYPPDDERSNAVKNFNGAVTFISGHYVKNGVFFAYANPAQAVIIYIGTRINEADLYSDRFSPFGNEPFGVISENEFIYNKKKINPLLENIKPSCHIECDRLYSNTLLLKSFPGMDYSFINVENSSLKAVVNIMYHSATACTSGNDNTSFLKFIERCKENDVDVYCVSFKNRADMYSSAKSIIDAGAIPIVNISYEAAYAKAVIAYSINHKEIMKKNIFFESL
ncbi:MAG: asparaginase domain-containing protein [Oscillospiraceae bacterium]